MATQPLPKTPKTSSKVRNQPSKVRVIARLRPFLPPEISNHPISSCVSVLESDHDCNGTLIHLTDRFTSRQDCYKLDAFYNEEDSVQEIFEKEVTPLIYSVFQGCNATVFACGATGSGKTHLMQGKGEIPGLMLRSMSMALGICERNGGFVEVSYYEVYMDKCFDLLQLKEQEVSVLDDKDGQVHLRGLNRVSVSSMVEFERVLCSSLERRKVAHTGLNDVSSRSHGVLVIVVSSPSCDGSGPVVVGKLNLIDLAGNEDNRRTDNEGIRLQESAKINRSLFTLSNVISALNNNEPRVPYRESKLTRILQDSLGGNSRSLMIACLNPSEYQESVNTVSLASRSCHMTNPISSARKEETPTMKIDMEEKLRAWLESKGKTRSTQRLRAFVSPLPSKTPLSTTRSIKKQSSCQSYAKVKDTAGQCSNIARRNLFKSGAPFDLFMEESCCSNTSKCYEEPKQCVEEYKDCSSVEQVDDAKFSNAQSGVDRAIPLCEDTMNTIKNVEEYNDFSSVKQVDDMKFFNAESCAGNNIPPFEDMNNAVKEVHFRNMEVFEENMQEGVDMCEGNHGTGGVGSNMEVSEKGADVQEDIQEGAIDICEEQTSGVASNREVFEECSDAQEGGIDMCEENQTSGVATNMEVLEECSDAQERTQDGGLDMCEKNHASGVTDTSNMPEIKASLPAELLNKENLACTPINKSMRSPVTRSLRKILSPINNNSSLKPQEDMPSKSATCKTLCALLDDGDALGGMCTPLDKYNARSSNLKSSLAQEYLEFLNSANKEELLKLKGIGPRRAEYIVELRDTSPFKSLSDLGKIGLSNKQVNGLFKRAAKGLFD